MMRVIIALITGGLFGAGLHLSGMTDTQKVLGFLDLFGAWDPTLMFVMGGALLPMAAAWAFASKREGPLSGGSFPAVADPRLDRKLILGAVMFGAGWGLAGFCPGPAIASLSYGGTSGAVFMAAMLAGMWFAPRLSHFLDSPIPAE